MISTEADQLRNDFLARLDAAMRDLPHGVAAEIRAGVAEELTGLDADAVASRIASLGDPVAIAVEAQREVPGVLATAAAPPVPDRRPLTSSRGYAIAAALTLSFGLYIVPFLGWVIGAVLVCFSPLWRGWEKAVAIAAPPSAALSLGLLLLPSYAVGSVDSATQVGEVSGIVGSAEGVNPLLPTSYDAIWFGAVLLGILVIPSGLWLLWRLRGRTSR